MGRDWRGWRAVKRSISAATRRNRDSSLFFSSLLLFALLFDTRVCQLLFHSSPFVSRPWSVFKADTLRSAPVQKRMQSCCARVEKTGEPLLRERERETLIFVNRRAWSSSTFGKNLSTYILCPFSSPLRSTFLVFPTFQTIVSKCGNFQLGGEALLPHPSRFGKIERSVLVPVVGRGGFVRVARSPMRAYISLSGNM